MDERAPNLAPDEELPIVPEAEPVPHQTPAAPRPAFVREYPVFGYE